LTIITQGLGGSLILSGFGQGAGVLYTRIVSDIASTTENISRLLTSRRSVTDELNVVEEVGAQLALLRTIVDVLNIVENTQQGPLQEIVRKIIRATLKLLRKRFALGLQLKEATIRRAFIDEEVPDEME
jgi:hypothetical protein